MALNLGDDLLMQKAGGPLLGSGIEAGLEATVKKRYDEAINKIMQEQIIFIPGIAFKMQDTSFEALYEDGVFSNQEAAKKVTVCAVILPRGATVVSVVVYGEAADTYTMKRLKFADLSKVTMASANMGTEDKIVQYATIDNELFTYYIETSAVDYVYGARIKYKL